MSRRAAYDLSNDNKKQDKNIESIEEIVPETEREEALEGHFPEYNPHLEDASTEFALLDREYACEDPFQNQRLCRFGSFNQKSTYGWKIGYIYILVLFTILLTIINATMTVWIVSHFGVDPNGFKGINLNDPRMVNINKTVRFSKNLFSNNIVAKNSLKLEQRNGTLTLVSGNSTLKLSPRGIVAITDKFEVHNSKIFKIKSIQNTSRAMVLGLGENNTKTLDFDVQKLKLNDMDHISLPQKLETRSIDAGRNNELQIRSRTGNITIASLGGQTAINSYLGPVSIMAKYNIKLRSMTASVTIESAGGIYLRNLKQPKSVKKDIPRTFVQQKEELKVFQLCICANGKLFIVHPQETCSINVNWDCH